MQPLLDGGETATTASQKLSRYLRTSWILAADAVLQLGDGTAVRFFPSEEADKLVAEIRKRNVFARHSWETNFYLQRASALANRTVIEVNRPGHPDDMIDEAEHTANLVERLALLSGILSLSRKSMQSQLAIREHRRSEFDLTIGPDFYYLRSRSKPEGNVWHCCGHTFLPQI